MGSTFLIQSLPPTTTSFTFDCADARAGNTLLFWAKSLTSDSSTYLDSAVVEAQAVVPNEMFPPTLTLEGIVQDTFSIKAMWTSVESAATYEVYFKKSMGSSHFKGPMGLRLQR